MGKTHSAISVCFANGRVQEGTRVRLQCACGRISS